MNTRLLRAVLCTIVVLLALLFNSSTVHAETLEIVLPNLVGLYDVDGVTSRQDTFRLVKSPTTVDNVSIRLTGIHSATLLSCEIAGTVEVPWRVIIDAIIPDVMTPATWVAHEYAPWYSIWSTIIQPPYEFETVFTFAPTSGATWDFLDTLEGTIVLGSEPEQYNHHICIPYPVEPSIEITWAVLVIEGEFSVGVEESSWGEIKALYSQ